MWSIRQKIKHVELKFWKTWKKIKTNPGLEEGSSTHTHIYTHTQTNAHTSIDIHIFSSASEHQQNVAPWA